MAAVVIAAWGGWAATGVNVALGQGTEKVAAPARAVDPAAPATRPATVASRAYGPWVSCRINGGGYVQSVVECPSDPTRFYAYVDMAGVYRSDDGGWSWRMMHATLPADVPNGYDVRGLSVDPRNADKLIICIGGHTHEVGRRGIYTSDDGGVDWKLVHLATFAGNTGMNRSAGYVIARSPSDPDVVITGGHGDGLHISRDNGATWETTGPAGFEFSDIDFDATNGSRAWASALPYKGPLIGKNVDLPGGLFITEDAGRSWSRIGSEGIAELIQAVPKAGEVESGPRRLVASFGYAEVRESGDNGRTWTKMSDGLTLRPEALGGSTSPYRWRMLGAGPGFLLTGNGNGDFWRIDGDGREWKPVVREHVDNAGWWGQPVAGGTGYARFGKASGAVTVSRWRPERWFMTDWYSIWRTEDAGRTWTPANEGYEPTVVHLVSGASRGHKDVVHLMMADNGHFVSTDGGKNFTQSGKGLTSQMRAVGVGLNDDRVMYALGKGHKSPGNWISNHVYRSLDQGKTWQSAPGAGLPDMIGKGQWACSVAVDPGDSRKAMVAVSGRVAPGEGGAYLTTDGGETWTWAGEGLPVQEKFFHDTFWRRTREVVTGGDGQFYAISAHSKGVYAWRADGSGGRWEKVFEGTGAPFSVDAARTPGPAGGAGLAVSVDGSGLWVSPDSGKTWSRAVEGRTMEVVFDPDDGSRLVVGTLEKGAGMMMSRDGGATWTMLDQRLPMRNGMRPTFAGGRLIVATSGGGAFFFDESAAGGTK